MASLELLIVGIEHTHNSTLAHICVFIAKQVQGKRDEGREEQSGGVGGATDKDHLSKFIHGKSQLHSMSSSLLSLFLSSIEAALK